ncbi:hypothetical protein LRS74_23160 [Streptomyces sp. LX-29]|uniref:SCO2583 family membrane protein n=1 Tax=Streptomyces sp. LX-29 TaxID=2900152 RepID=UPI00240E8072|nr:hypothetical protein [Streptomyces sp. LX-29]WFB09622.1 hypothetical protein LRS74_23160 [Streptomyces sp. LX-29]
MAGRGDPPEGTPEGVPGGADDEYRSVVFDEDFVRAARLQEFSAEERQGDHAPAVRSRHLWSRARASRQAVILVILIAAAFAAAVYMGVRHPYQEPRPRPAETLRSTVIPLAPADPVPGGSPADLFRHSRADQYRGGADGVTLPPARRTDNFSESQVMSALTTARDYVVASAVDREVVRGAATQPVRLLLDAAQYGQFEQSLERPAADGRHAVTGWLIRFDPAQVALADEPVRVRGTFTVDEATSSALEVTAAHTYVYAVRPAGAETSAPASLYTVRRELRLRLDHEDLRDHRVEVVQSRVQAGPQSCAADSAAYLRPLLAGQRAGSEAPSPTDPFALSHDAPLAACGLLAPSAQPSGLPAGDDG